MEIVAGRYRVERVLGSGGAGEVLRVVDQSSGKRLALKRLHGNKGGARRRRMEELRMRREFHVLASLRHPCIVEVYDFGVDARGPWYTMELLDGADLREAAPLPPAEVCRILRDVAAALAHLHARRFVHRDVAPRNVCEGEGGRVRLLDFGVLSTMGQPRDVVGTPPCVAPEALHLGSIDGRTDLFGLGVVGYYLLTNRFPYPARTLDELDTLWEKRAPPPSKRGAAVPAALDELIMGMISLDPLGRPSSAAEIVDRLGGIASLGPAPEVARHAGSFDAAAIVGRTRELRALEEHVRAAIDGRGAAVSIEGPSGIGKSRLLRELALSAKTHGATVVVADGGEAARGPYGVMQRVVRSIFEAAPPKVLELGAPFASSLARVLPAFASRYPHVDPSERSGDPGEDRLRVHQAIVSFALEAARSRPLVLVIDEAQRCDEASAAVLASLAHAASAHPLLVGVVVRSDEPVRAEAAFQVIAGVADRMHLRGLEPRHVERMLQSLFGDVPNVLALAEQMHAVAGGNPLLLTELVHHLSDRGVIRDVDGLWTLPERLRRRDLPDGLTDALDGRVRELPKPARELGQILAWHDGPSSLDLCVEVLDRDENRAFAALDALVGHDVLVGSEERYSFRHDGLREAFRRSIDPRRLPRIHLTIGRALLTVGDDGEASIGWHLLRGGDAWRGADLLARAGRALFEAQSFSDAVTPLEDALSVWETGGKGARECLELRHMLLVAGVMADRSVVLRYADATLEQLRLWSGVDAAAKLAPFVGKHLALIVALVFAFVRWGVTWPSKRGPNPFSALSRFFVSTTYAATAYSLSFEHRRTASLVRTLEPFVVLRRRILYASYLMTRCFHHLTLGRFGTVDEEARRALQIAESDRLTPISRVDRAHGIGAAVYMLAAVRILDHDRACEEHAERLDGLGLRFFAASASIVRALFHRMRGEEVLAREHEALAESTFIGLGSAWILESQRVWASSLGHALGRDLLGLRRSIDAMVRLCDEGYRIEAHAELARGEYLRERGELEASLRAIDSAIALAPPEHGFIEQAALSARAETLLALGRPGEAIRAADACIALGADADTGRIAWRLRSARVRALAEAALGDQRGAAARLDALIEEARPIDSPTLSGMLHEARARVALLLGDEQAYTTHRDATRRWFRGTRNPALVARADRLVEAGGIPITGEQAIELLGDDVATVRGARRRSSWVSLVLDRCADAEERAARALEVVREETGATDAHLYLVRPDGLVHAASSTWRRPPEEVAIALEAAVAGSRRGTEPEEPTKVRGAAWHTLLLHGHGEGDGPVCVGAVALSAGPGTELRRPDPAMIDAIVRKLRTHHDVASVSDVSTERSG